MASRCRNSLDGASSSVNHRLVSWTAPEHIACQSRHAARSRSAPCEPHTRSGLQCECVVPGFFFYSSCKWMCCIDPDVVLSSWISSDYTVARSVKKIRRLFESTSSCQLCDFLLPARAHALNTAFKATLDGNSHPDTAQWALEGSPERQHFHT